MRFRRRLTFQLTPLLDLLLIVIFAQYMELRDVTRREQARAQAMGVEAATFAERAAAAEHVERRRQQAVLELARQELAQVREQLDIRQAALTDEIQQALERQQLLGELVAELFRIPEPIIESVLKSLRAGDPPRSTAEVEQLREQFRELAARRGFEAVKHLLAHAELRKRVDIWDVSLDRRGIVTLDTGQRQHEFRFVELDDVAAGNGRNPDEAAARAAERFAEELFDIYKALPQPKGVVIVLFSYGNVPYAIRKPAFDGLRLAADRMRADSSGLTRFEYASLGFLPLDAGDAGPPADNPSRSN